MDKGTSYQQHSESVPRGTRSVISHLVEIRMDVAGEEKHPVASYALL